MLLAFTFMLQPCMWINEKGKRKSSKSKLSKNMLFGAAADTAKNVNEVMIAFNINQWDL